MELKTELKEFQKKTVVWMKEHEQMYDGGMLLHEPGLGKSLITLSLICDNPLKTLVIVNSGLIDNWIDEIKKHTNISRLKIVKYYGSTRHKYVKDDKHLVYITSYSIVAREFNKGAFDKNSILSKVKFERIVLDEAHYIRNSKSNINKSITYLGDTNIGIKKWIVTATPIFNDPVDTFAYFKFLNLEGIDTRSDWTKQITKSVHGLYTLNNWIKKYGISYKKENVLKELKSKNEENVQLNFNQLENDFYNALKEYSQSRMKNLVKRIEKLNKSVFTDINGSMKKIIHTNVMVYILRLKQACNSPWLVIQCMERLRGIKDISVAVEKLKFYNESSESSETEECPVCYDANANFIADPCGHKCCESCWNKMFNAGVVNCPKCRTYVDEISCINKTNEKVDVDKGSFNLSHVKDTSKIKYVIELTKNIIKKSEKIVIVSQWVGMLNIIRNIFDSDDELKDIKYVSLQGNIPLKNRSKYISEFQNNKDTSVCFISLMSSAEGINLTAGNHLVLMDSWWNESKMIQVSDRIHRIGQSKQVNIYKLQIIDSIEEKIQELVNKKSKMANIVLTKWKIDNNNYDDSWMKNMVKLITSE
jgi:SNF2 family DNA or RNA helicase